MLGAGASIPAGMPSTEEITNRILTGDEIVREYSDDTYRLGKFSWEQFGFKEEYIWRVKECIEYIMNVAKSYYKGSGFDEINYEDIYYVAIQIYNGVMYEYRNPALAPLISDAKKTLSKLLIPLENEDREEWLFEDLFNETAKYIENIAWRMIDKPVKNIKHLEFIESAYKAHDIQQLDIFTLNHDRVLDEFFKQKSIDIIDGFETFKGRFQTWNEEVFDNSNGTPRVFRLHGSIDWYGYIRYEKQERNYLIAKYLPLQTLHDLGIPGLDPSPMPSEPHILVGTYNKLFDYQRPVFFEMQCYFHKSLKQSNKLFVTGYSFNDRTINDRIGFWMEHNKCAHTVIAHAKYEELIKNSSRAMASSIENWRGKGRLQVVPRMIEDIDWFEIEEAFEEMVE